MKYSLLVALVLLTLTDIGSAAGKPSFTGQWKMNLAKSNYGGFPAPTSLIRKITLKEPTLVIVEDQTGGSADGTTVRNYTTDGKPSSFEINGTPVVGTAIWEGAAIIVSSNVESVGLSFKDKMSLSADGKELTSNVEISSGQGDAELTVVFERE